MMLRIMLVGLVASLGLELPSNGDIAHWTRSGREWASARLADLTEFQAETGRAFASQSEADANVEAPATPIEAASPAASTDLAFQAAADKVAGEIAADLAAVAPASPSAELVAKVEAPKPEVEVLAPAIEAPAPVVAAESDAVPSDEEEVAMLSESSPTRADRINSAVKLTYQAVNAWASALQPADEVDASR